jgi:ABC-type branched-subunit amino acid transport system ATPase component
MLAGRCGASPDCGIFCRMNATIEIDGLRKRFGEAQALDGMTFTVHLGQATGFIGPNGTGKSTTAGAVLVGALALKFRDA